MSLIQEALEKARLPKPLMQHSKIPIGKMEFPEKPKIQEAIKIEERVVAEKKDFKSVPAKQVFPKEKPSTTVPAGAYIILILLAAVIGIANLLFQSKAEKIASPSLTAEIPSMPVSSIFPTKYTLTGVTFSGGLRMALVNNQIVRVGDRLKGNAVVKEIADRNVTLQVQGRDIKLTL